ncbi:MAG: polymer-forming cytoskeletal protein [Deferribacteres bacterium]|nr:polymer-forming cytoskeletal protein [candidate division KSB1 bacterium]MCB9511751.1 polymer-forming cytoskeletal protein [Deferribacteres bacterium]
MLGKKEVDEFDRSGDLNTFIGKGTYFEGTVKVQSSIRVDGQIKGRITTSDTLIVGKEGEVDGEVSAKNAIIGGKVRGKIHATGRVMLEAQSLFQGELQTAKLVINEGAFFDGVCSMGQGDGKSAFKDGEGAKSLLGAPQKSMPMPQKR